MKMIKKITCLVLFVLLLFTCVGCDSKETIEDTDTDSKSMFVVVEEDYLRNKYHIVYHKETKVMYAVSSDTVFTVMVDADGKPLLWEE